MGGVLSEPTLDVDQVAGTADATVDTTSTTTQEAAATATESQTSVAEPVPAAATDPPLDDQSTSTAPDEPAAPTEATTESTSANTTDDSTQSAAPTSSGDGQQASTDSIDDTNAVDTASSGQASGSGSGDGASSEGTGTVGDATNQTEVASVPTSQTVGSVSDTTQTTLDSATQAAGNTTPVDGGGGLAEGTLATGQGAGPVPTPTDTLQAVGDPVESATGSLPTLTDRLETTTGQLAEPVPTLTDTLQAVGDPVESATGSVPTLTDRLETARDPLQTVTDPLQTLNDSGVHQMGGALDQATGNVQQTLDDPVQQTLDDPVGTVTDTVQQPVGDPVQTVGETVQPVAQPATDAVQPVADTVQPVGSTVTGSVGDATQAGASMVDGSTSAVDATVKNVGGQADGALTGAGESIRSSTEHMTDGKVPLADKVTTLLTGTGAPTPTDVVSGTPVNLPEDTTLAPPGIAEGGQPLPGDDGGLFAGFPFTGHEMLSGANEALIVSAAVATIAGVAMAVRPSGVASAQFFLANVRQIPAVCGGLQVTANRGLAAVAAGATQVADVAGSAPGRAIATVESYSIAIREGFNRGAEGAVLGSGSGDDGARDIRLLMQIGMLLGTAYLAFLTVWFWATRLRWSPRA
jgi:hypothetical protein